MHIPKLLAVFCLAASSVGSLQAQNSGDQARSLTWDYLLPAPKAQETPPQTLAMNASPQQTMPSATPEKTLTPEQQAKAREELRKSIMAARAAEPSASATEATPTPPPVTEPAKTTPAPAPAKPAAVPAVAVTNSTPQPAVVTPVPTPTSVPEVAPAPAPGSKEARLKELDDKYKTGALTAVEYQAERAKIRAEK